MLPPPLPPPPPTSHLMLIVGSLPLRHNHNQCGDNAIAPPVLTPQQHRPANGRPPQRQQA